MEEFVPIKTLNECFDECEHFNFGIRNNSFRTKDKKHIRPPHKHDFYYILFVNKGSGHHTIDFISYPVKDYSVYFVSPGQVHSLQLDESTTGFTIFFEPEFYLMNSNPRKLYDFPFFHTLSNEPALYLDEEKFKVIQQTTREIFKEYSDFDIGRHQVIRAYIDVLLVKLSRYFNQNESLLGKPLRTIYVIRELEHLIDQHFITIRSASEYADMMNISAKHLNDIVKKSINKTVTNLIHERIIIEAKRLLLYTDFTISQIAHELDYLDKSYFLRFFKKKVGMTPETYRNKNLEKLIT